MEKRVEDKKRTNGVAHPSARTTTLIDDHPVGALAAACGVGYLMGGGLFTSMTARMVRWGLRLGMQFAVLPALERELTGLTGNHRDA